MIGTVKPGLMVLTVTLTLPLLAACTTASPQWQKSGLTESEVSSAVAACERWARKEAEDDYFRNQAGGAPDPLGRSSTYDANMAAYQVKQSTKELTRDCLVRQGFRPKTQDP